MAHSPLPIVAPGRALWVVVLLVLGSACADSSDSQTEAVSPGSEPAETRARPSVPAAAFDVRAVTLDARRRPSDATLDDIAALGSTDIALIPFGFQQSPQSPAIRRHTDGDWYSESTRGIRDLAERARRRGMGIILKPHIWIGHYSADGQNRHAIGFDTEAAWERWERQYRAFLLYYAALAEDINARVLVIGSELERAATERPGFWRSLIAGVRERYDGALTYAANWSGDPGAIPFWDALDYVGVQAYFPLLAEGVRRDSVTVDRLADGWSRRSDKLRSMSDATGKPVLFTELGYRSAPDAASAPWLWPENGGEEAPDPELQALCYRAFFQVLGDAPWLTGAIIWKWHPEPESRRPTGFTPQHKPAVDVLRQGFGAPNP